MEATTALTLAEFLTNVGSVMTSAVTWLSTALTFIEAHLWVIVPSVLMGLVGMVFVYIRGTIRG